MTRPREFWISGIDFKTYAIPKEGVCTAFITLGDPGKKYAIKVREVVLPEAAPDKDACDIIIDLQHQRSIAFDEARKYRLAYEIAKAALETLKVVVNNKQSDVGAVNFIANTLDRANALIGGQDESK